MKSQNIAVAGGAGKLGRHLVEGLLEIKDQHSLRIIVLSRSQGENISFGNASAPVIAVDYQDRQAIRKVLDEHHIDTVISTIVDSGNPDLFISAQSNLLHAALSVPSFHRFAPSEFGVDSEQIGHTIKFFQSKYPILRELEQVKRERPDSFEYTRFNCGIFLNYLGYGNTKPDGEKALGHLAHFPFIFDLSKPTVDVPGDGSSQMVLTRVEDVGKFVAAATQLETWEEYSEMAGDILTLNQILKLSEDVLGHKLDVKYLTKADVLARMDPTPSRKNLLFQGMLAIIDGDWSIKRPANLNNLVDVKPVGAEEFLKQWWGQ